MTLVNLEILSFDMLHHIILFVDIKSLLTIYSISTIFAEFSRLNLRSILCKILQRTITRNIQYYDMKQLIELSKFPFNYVSYHDFDMKNIIFSDPTEYNYDLMRQDQDMVYNIINLQYDYGINDEFIISGCEMESDSGVKQIMFHPYEVQNFSMKDAYTLNDCIEAEIKSFDERFINVMNIIYKSCVNILYDNMYQMKMLHFRKDMPESAGFKNFIIYQIDEETYQIIHEKNSNILLKLSRNFQENLIFNNKHINIEKIRDKKIKFIPFIHIRFLYSKFGSCKLQHEIIGAKILNIS